MKEYLGCPHRPIFTNTLGMVHHIASLSFAHPTARIVVGEKISGPDVTALAHEGREGQSQEAQRASSKKSGPGGHLDV